MKKDAKESAKEIRRVLGQSWPGVKFSVRVKRFAGGSSVHVNWMDGPTEKEVRRATNHLKGWDEGYYNEYISTSRRHSREAMEAAAKAVAEYYGVPVPEVVGGDSPYIADYTDTDGELLCDRIHHATWRTSLYNVDIAKAFDEALPAAGEQMVRQYF